MNSWFLTGEVLKHGIKGTTYKTLWIQAAITSPHESIQSNKVFLNFPIDSDTSTKKGRIGQAVISKLDKCRFFFAQDIAIVPINVGVKKEDGSGWDNKEVPGVRGNISNLSLSQERYPLLNNGSVSGTVGKYITTGSVEKYLVQERYRNPKTNEYKIREVPILNPNPVGQDLSGKSICVFASMCGVTPERESKTFGWAKNIIIL